VHSRELGMRLPGFTAEESVHPTSLKTLGEIATGDYAGNCLPGLLSTANMVVAQLFECRIVRGRFVCRHVDDFS
jgi:hypothetical protein